SSPSRSPGPTVFAQISISRSMDHLSQWSGNDWARRPFTVKEQDESRIEDRYRPGGRGLAGPRGVQQRDRRTGGRAVPHRSGDDPDGDVEPGDHAGVPDAQGWV